MYYNLTAFEQDYYLNENFNGKSITNQAELEQYTALTLTGAGAAVQTQNALGGRGDGDTSLTVSAVELGEEAVTLGWTPDTVIDSDAITIEQSVLLQEGTALELTADFGAAAGSIVQFGSVRRFMPMEQIPDAHGRRAVSIGLWQRLTARRAHGIFI